jgi:hypothetical protein
MIKHADLTVIQFLALVRRNRKIVTDHGGTPDDGDELSIILKGLLQPEFTNIVDNVSMTTNITLPDAKQKILDYAQSKGLENVTKAAGKTKHQTFVVHDDGSNGGGGRGGGGGGHGKPSGNRDRFAAGGTPACRDWSKHKCRWGESCRYGHDGPGGYADAAPGTCPRCKGAHLASECSTTKEPASVNIADGDPPVDYVFCGFAPTVQDGESSHKFALLTSALDKERHAAQVVQEKFLKNNDCEKTIARSSCCSMVGIVGFFVAAFLSLALASTALAGKASRVLHQVFQSPHKVALLVVAVTLLLSVTVVDGQSIGVDKAHHVHNKAIIMESTFYANEHGNGNKHATDVDPDLEWCSDPGTNRYVTNDINDFQLNSRKDTPTIVAVGGGNVTSPCSGTVLIKSLDHGCTIQCNNVLYIKECPKKLMPAPT